MTGSTIRPQMGIATATANVRADDAGQRLRTRASVRDPCERTFVMNSNVKGAVAEQAIVLAATKLRIPVWPPVAEHGRADLVLEIGGA